jgi:hypothetical protein
MLIEVLTNAAQQYFPKLQIGYKNQSKWMAFLGFFLKKDFMTECVTTSGNTIYFPNQHFIKCHPISSVVLFLHEIVRMHSSKKKAYLSSLYVIYKLSKQMHFVPHLNIQSKNFMEEMHKPWTNYSSLQQEFQSAIDKIQTGERPYQDPIFDMLDDLIAKL